jgi:glucose-6-phosphate isomerase
MSHIAHSQDLDLCFGAGSALDASVFRETLAATAPVLAEFGTTELAPLRAVLDLPGRRDDLPEQAALAADWRARFSHIVVVGTGGSSLGARTLLDALATPDEGPRIEFLENADPRTLETLLAHLEPPVTGVLAISKSGATAETLAQTLILLAHFRGRGLDPAMHFRFLSEPDDNPMRALARAFAIPVFDHDPDVGGRFSVLSPVGMLPALCAGLDVARIREGAQAVLDQTLAAGEPNESFAAAGAALNVAAARQMGVSATVLLPYLDRLRLLGLWFRQLWAESLGKDGHGTTPIDALGTVDQHSQLQLWLDGPNDKLFTLIELGQSGSGTPVPRDFAELAGGLDYLAGRSLGDLINAAGRATAETLAERGRPVRRIVLERLDEVAFGGLLMQLLLETLIAARLFGVDPFGQPAVEDGKRRMRGYLQELEA